MHNKHDQDLLELARKYVEEAEKNAAENPTSEEILVVIVEPYKKPYKKMIKNSLDAFQSIVGGYIENVTIGKTDSGAMIGITLNEEGKLMKLPVNRKIIGRGGSDIFVGNFFITAYNMQGDNVSLSDKEANEFIRRFSAIEVYI